MIAVGERLPELAWTLRLPDLIAYAGATWDWHRLHYDPAYLAERGLTAPVVDGQLFGALLAEQLIGWLGPQARITTLHFRFKALVFAGETVRCQGEVSTVQQTAAGLLITVRQQVMVDGVDGAAGRLAVDPAGATIVLPAGAALPNSTS